MTPTNLLKCVAAEIVEATRELRLPTEYMRQPARENFVKVNVFLQSIPPDLFEKTTYFPCVVIELLSIRDNLKSGSVAEVALTAGVYAKEEDGWQDLFHLQQVIRQRLLTRRVIDKKFRLVDELITSYPDTQPLPFMFGYQNAQYNLYLPQEELPT